MGRQQTEALSQHDQASDPPLHPARMSGRDALSNWEEKDGHKLLHEFQCTCLQ